MNITPYNESPLDLAARLADAEARLGRLAEYQEGKSPETLRRHQADLDLFQSYLADKYRIVIDDLYSDIQEWQGITFGLVDGFKRWQKDQGYALSSVNVRLATVRRYAKIAAQSGVIPIEVGAAIQGIEGYTKDIARNVDEKRLPEQRRRPEAKKAHPTPVSLTHLRALKNMLEEDHTYLGYRDMLLLCLLGLQGFRCGEIAILRVDQINMSEGVIILYRHKVNKTHRHDMAEGTLLAFQRYFAAVRPTTYVFEGVNKRPWQDDNRKSYKGHKATSGLSTRAINDRVKYLGKLVGIEKLSPHDLRHYWTKDLFKLQTPIETVKTAGGWNSYSMPERYRGEVEIANKDVKQSTW